MNRHGALTVFFVTALAALSGGGVLSGRAQQSTDGVWVLVSGRPQTAAAARADIVGQSAVARLDRTAFDTLMQSAPNEASLRAAGGTVVSLPMPDGRFTRFRVALSPMLAPELAAAFPEIRTFTGQGIDDSSMTTRFGWTSAGFHAIVLSTTGTVYIDPYAPGDLEFYVAVGKNALQQPGVPFQCLVTEVGGDAGLRSINAFPITNGTSLRTYRLALAATGEYTAAAGGTKSAALARMVATMNRVNGIYERDLAVRMTLITGGTDPTELIYTSAATDPYDTSSTTFMLIQNQANVDSVVGSANYEIGHVFYTGGGGVAGLGVTCLGGQKARGLTGLQNPVGDAFDVDYVAHELGHQFGGNHPFNGSTGNCGGGNRSASHAYEVGSASTIMGYAGICGAENLQPNSNDYFTVESLNEMTAFITSGGGSTCGAATATGNTVPTAAAIAALTIPINTPFTLTAVGTDANGDSLTYDWEQYSLGTASTDVATASTDDGSRPIFRSYSPSASVSRTFPSLTYILNNANTPPTTYACSIGTCLTGEVLPSTSRAMTFHVTVRDNRAGGGGITTGQTVVTSTTAAGPFRVTSPNTAVSLNAGPQTITWNAAGTAAAPVNAANVRILLSTDGGTTFATELIASTANDGTETVTLPNTPTSTARIKVEAVGNIFFDVSDANFSIAPPSMFTDDPLVSGATSIKAVHVTELRTYINTLRARYNLQAFSYTNTTLTAGTSQLNAVDVAQLRVALSEAYVAAGMGAITYTTGAITAGTTNITAAQIAEIRAKVLAIY